MNITRALAKVLEKVSKHATSDTELVVLALYLVGGRVAQPEEADMEVAKEIVGEVGLPASKGLLWVIASIHAGLRKPGSVLAAEKVSN